jgi:hypothetical protein
MQIDLKRLRIDGGTQLRDAVHDATVAEYVEALRGGAKFPPVVVFRDGATHWLADGFHRCFAHRRAGLDKIEADIREGTLRDAILFSVGANAAHGLRRAVEDKRKCVTAMLTHELVRTDAQGNPWSDREIARQCGVGHAFVGRVRASLDSESSETPSQCRAYTNKHGGKSTMNTANIRQANQSRKQEPAEPDSVDNGACAPGEVHAEDEPPMPSIAAFRKDPDKCVQWLIDVFGHGYMWRVHAEMDRLCPIPPEAVDRAAE